MSDFWEHAFDSLGDNLEIIGAVQADVIGNLNPFSDQFLSGDAYTTASVVESQNARDENRPIEPNRIHASGDGGLALISEAASETASQVKTAAGDVVSFVTNPWVIGGVVTVVVAIFAAPYVVPALKAVTS